MATRYKPIFYRRRRKWAPGAIALLTVSGIAAYLIILPSDNPISVWALSLPSLYQWIPAVIMWLTLLVMLTISVFGPRKD